VGVYVYATNKYSHTQKHIKESTKGLTDFTGFWRKR